MDDLNRAIMTKEQTVASTPDDHPNRAMYLNNLGTTLHSRFERTGSMKDLDQAITRKEQAVMTEAAPPSIRLKAASSCSDLLISSKDYKRSKPILEQAVRLLLMISPRVLKRSDAEHNISQFSNITSRAVSISLEDAEDPYHSLQLLELGRGILANLQLEVRSDISVLATSRPDLAQQFQKLRDQIDLPAVIADSSVIFNSALDSSIFINERQILIKQFDDLLRFIRSLPGFEAYLRGPSASEMQSLADRGPIVVFNVSDIRSDAFLITTDGIHSLRLPLLTFESLLNSAIHFLNAINNRSLKHYRYANDELNAVLEWLWDAAVKPVLNELGFIEMPPHDKAWPRVWWVGSGLLSILPIHAAGYHNSIPPETALDRVISSYASTVNSLSYAREKVVRVEQVTSNEKAILVAMPTTPQKEILPFVKIEMEEMRKLFSERSIDTTIMQNPTKKDVLSELPNHAIAHFACHGYSAYDSSHSSLFLEDTCLTVSDLVSLNIEAARLAYLSACHTSVTRNVHLLDESISLSSIFQLSGYPSVVGSLWHIQDGHSVEIAKSVYAWILEGGELDTQRSGEGLHRAVRILRDKTRFKSRPTGKNDPLVWAPYIHVGV